MVTRTRTRTFAHQKIDQKYTTKRKFFAFTLLDRICMGDLGFPSLFRFVHWDVLEVDAGAEVSLSEEVFKATIRLGCRLKLSASKTQTWLLFQTSEMTGGKQKQLKTVCRTDNLIYVRRSRTSENVLAAIIGLGRRLESRKRTVLFSLETSKVLGASSSKDADQDIPTFFYRYRQLRELA
jgi:hypothetical protein